MKNYNTVFLSFAFFFFFLFISSDIYSQVTTSVYDINRNPGRFMRENVQVEGLIVRYVPGSSTTLAYYIIRDDMGEEIQVNTTVGPPETNVKYRITGVLYHENRQLFISELTRESLAPVAEPPPPPPPPPAQADNTMLYIIGLAALLLFLIVLFVLYSRKQQKTAEEVSVKQIDAVPKIDEDAYQTFLTGSGENTIVVDREYMTMKALPGSLVVLNGEQADKKLSLFGASTSEGQVITIGRDSPDWKKHLKSGREHAHIRIQDSTKTLSRLQAELILANGEMKLRNLGQANPTVVDNQTLQVGETTVLKSGSVIQAGNLKLRYET